MNYSFDRRLWLAFATYLLALAIRLPGLNSQDIRPDETTWLERSEKVLVRLAERPFEATTHLGHPGLPPALLMASAQWSAKKWNSKIVPKVDFLSPIDRLLASRLAIVFFASLIVPLIYLSLATRFGQSMALLSAILVALDPRHVGYSRTAHLDAVEAVFIFACIACYIRSEIKKEPLVKLLSGVFWGLAVLTKPTAAALVIAFISYRFYHFILLTPKAQRRFSSLLPLADVGALLIGHLAMSLPYTRFWVHRSDYLTRLGVQSRLADIVYHTGRWLQAHYWLVALLLFCVIYFAWRQLEINRKRGTQITPDLLPAITCLGLVVAGLSAFPQVYENIIRFWTWTAGLSGVIHKAYGQSWSGEPAGYLLILLTRLPEVILLGLIAGIVYLMREILKNPGSNRGRVLLIHCLCATFWMLILNTSGKQTWRYILPVVPSLYLLASFGLISLAGSFRSLLRVPAFPALNKAALISLCIIQALSLFSYAPVFDLYSNSFTSFLHAAPTVTHGAPALGQRQVISLLMAQVRQRESAIYIATVGDTKIWYHQAARMFGKEGRKLQFGLFPLESTDFVMHTPELDTNLIQRELALVRDKAPAFEVKFKDQVLLSLYEMPFPTYPTPLKFEVNRARHHTGRVAKTKQGQITIAALPGRDLPASMLFHEGFRVKPGDYQFRASLRYKGDAQKLLGEAALPAVRFEMGNCQKDIAVGELDSETFKALDMICHTASNNKLSPRVFWYGQAPVEVRSFEFEQVNLG